MESQMGLSVEKYANMVIEKLGGRLEEISWGDNCDNVRDALKFDEELFANETKSEEEKNAFYQFLFKEGFQPKKMRINGVERAEWYYPIKPKNSMLADFRNSLVARYNEFIEMARSRVEGVLNDFLNSEYYCKFYLMDGVQAKVMQEEIIKYNQETIIFNNRRNANFQRPFIIDVPHDRYPITLLFKQEADKEIIDTAEQTYLKKFWEKVYELFFFVNNAIRYVTIYNGKMFVRVDSEFAKPFRELFESLGIKASFFANDSKSAYADIMRAAPCEEEVTIYMEVTHALEYRPIFEKVDCNFKGAVNSKYREFCMFVNRNNTQK
ncbi:MAG: hypothetical protein J6C46_09765 [Clostridia bacterium]|nr:hypothetical protein [Clostridia bacterium]